MAKFILNRIVRLSIVFLSIVSYADSGVAGMTKYLRATFKSAWKTLQPQSKPTIVDHLCIDMNQILHSSIRSTSSPNGLIFKIFAEVDDIIRLVQPRKSLVFAFDGTAPFAKMQTQRSRRKTRPESSLCTPGTVLMNSMGQVMLSYAFQRMKVLMYRNVTVFVSDGQSPGEGELKIVHWLGSHLGAANGSVADSVAICGSDADIILQAIVLMNASNIFVLQTGTVQHSYLCNISILVDGFMQAASRVNTTTSNFHFQQLKANDTEDKVANRRWNRLAAGNKSLPLDWDLNYIQHSFRLDSLVLLLLQGNDYLPKMRGVSLSRIWRSYSLAMRQLQKSERYLVDMNRRTYNFKALWLLVMEFRAVGDARIPMPLQIPCSISAFHSAVTRIFQLTARDVVLAQGLYHEVSKSTSDGSIDVYMWGARLALNGKNYSVDAKYLSKKAAKTAIADMILLDIDPEGYASLVQRKETIAKKLEEMRSRSLEERAAFASQHGTCSGSSEQLLELTKNLGRSEYFEPESVAALEPEEDGYERTDDTWLYSEELDNNYCDERFYLDYLCDSDVVAYLKGILWVANMYIRGKCSDLSFTFTGRPPINPFSVIEFIVRMLNTQPGRNISALNELIRQTNEASSGIVENQVELLAALDAVFTAETTAFLEQILHAPTNDLRPLSPDATCVCVIPEGGIEFIPSHLRGQWKWMQENFFSKTSKSSLSATTYQELTEYLQQYFNQSSRYEDSSSLASYHPASEESNDVPVPLSDEDDDEPDDRQFVKRQIKSNANTLKLLQKWARQVSTATTTATATASTAPAVTASWRSRAAVSKRIEKAMHRRVSGSPTSPSDSSFSPIEDPALEDTSESLDSESVFAPRLCELWTVLTDAETSLKEKGYQGDFKRKVLDLPFPFSIRTPSVLPKGLRAYSARHITTSE